MKVRTEKGVQQILGFLKFCTEQNFLFQTQVKVWLFQNYNYSSLDSACTMSKRLMKNLKKDGFVEFKESRLFRRRKINVSKQGINLLIDNGLISPTIQYRPLDDRQEKHDSYVTDVRLVWEKR